MRAWKSRHPYKTITQKGQREIVRPVTRRLTQGSAYFASEHPAEGSRLPAHPETYLCEETSVSPKVRTMFCAVEQKPSVADTSREFPLRCSLSPRVAAQTAVRSCRASSGTGAAFRERPPPISSSTSPPHHPPPRLLFFCASWKLLSHSAGLGSQRLLWPSGRRNNSTFFSVRMT